MLYSAVNVRDNIRNRDGKRVFYVGKGDQLTSEARDFLSRERIEILPAEQAKQECYKLLNGGFLSEKPEHMTHLRGNILVPKTHPIITFRGSMDTLQAEILLAQLIVAPKMRQELEQILTLTRNILRWEVMEEPAEMETLCGLTPEQLRSHSHYPQAYYGQAHFMPSWSDGPSLLQLNKVRCAARNAELAAVHAFCDEAGNCLRSDILMLLNRISSMVYLLMIRLKSAKRKGGVT